MAIHYSPAKKRQQVDTVSSIHRTYQEYANYAHKSAVGSKVKREYTKLYKSGAPSCKSLRVSVRQSAAQLKECIYWLQTIGGPDHGGRYRYPGEVICM